MLLLALVGTYTYHLWLGVPYVPTPKRVTDAALDLAALQDGETLCDLGAGDARVLVVAGRRCPGAKLTGCELVPTVWLLGKAYLWLTRTKAAYHCADAMTFPVADADVVFLYLTPGLMGKLAARLERELRPGTRVVCHTFQLPGRTPERSVSVPLPWGKATVRLYRW